MRGLTAVGAGEEYLSYVGIWPGHGIDTSFVIQLLARPVSLIGLVMVVWIGGLGACLLKFESAGAEGWEEFDATLVESQGMAEIDDGVVRAREWQVFWNQSDGLHGVPAGGYEAM